MIPGSFLIRMKAGNASGGGGGPIFGCCYVRTGQQVAGDPRPAETQLQEHKTLLCYSAPDGEGEADSHILKLGEEKSSQLKKKLFFPSTTRNIKPY